MSLHVCLAWGEDATGLALYPAAPYQGMPLETQKSFQRIASAGSLAGW